MKYSETTGARFGHANGRSCSAQIRTILASLSSQLRTLNTDLGTGDLATPILQHSHRGKPFAADQRQFFRRRAGGRRRDANNFIEPPGTCGNYDTGLVLHGGRVI
jgi:hypothetical protein